MPHQPTETATPGFNEEPLRTPPEEQPRPSPFPDETDDPIIPSDPDAPQPQPPQPRDPDPYPRYEDTPPPRPSAD